jgi:cysteine desulfurase
VIEGALRIGLGKFTTEEEIDQASDILSTTVSQVRQAMFI